MRILHLDAGREMRGGQWQVLRLIEGLAAAGVESTLLAREDAPLFALARQWGRRFACQGQPRAGDSPNPPPVLGRSGQANRPPHSPGFSGPPRVPRPTEADEGAFTGVGRTPWSAAGPLAGSRPGADEGAGCGPGGPPHPGEWVFRVADVQPLTLARAAWLSRRHDLVHAHDARSHTLAALVALAAGPPLVVSRRVAFPVRSRWKYGRPRRYLAVSEFVRGVLEAGGVPAEKIEVVYDGVPLLEPARGETIVAPANAGDPEKGAALARQAARLAGVELQFSTNLERDLLHAGLLVYVTHSEGLGSGVLLAMSAGVPAVASNVGGLPEVVRHGENGMLAENTPESIAAAIRQLRADPALARRLGAAARRTVMERFTVERMVGRTMEVYRQVLS